MRIIELGINHPWIEDCMKWRSVVLTGIYRHWCNDWDGLPIDETCPEFPCVCFDSLWFRIKWCIVEWWINL